MCAAPAIAALYTYCHPPGKKAIHIDGKRLKKLAKFVEFPGFVSRTDNKAYMDYLRIPHANRAQSLLPQLFLIRLYFARSYKRNLHLIILEFYIYMSSIKEDSELLGVMDKGYTSK